MKNMSRTVVLLFGAFFAVSVMDSAVADTQVRTSSFEYDSNGILIREILEPDRPNDCLQSSYAYDNWGNKISVSMQACAGASGEAVSSANAARTATTSFGTNGRFPISTTNALGHTETKTFDAATGSLTSLTGPNGLATTWQNDVFGRKTRETLADGTYTTWAYKLCTDSGSNCPGPIGGAASIWVLIEQSYSVNNVAKAAENRQYHDALGRVVRVQTMGWDGAGASSIEAQDTEYNSLGNVARKSTPYALSGGSPFWTEYSYDVLGNVTQERVPDPAAPGGIAITSIAYNGLNVTVTNPKGQSKTTKKNIKGQVVRVIDAVGGNINYAYDAVGNLLQTNVGGIVTTIGINQSGEAIETVTAGSITTLSYDKRGRKIGMADPAMGAWQYRYNVFGELVWQRDSLGQVSTQSFDKLGRLVSRSEPDLLSQWSYDKKFDGTSCGKGVAKLCEAKADNGYKRTHTYDNSGRLINTATVLDSVTTPAIISTSFDANTGKVARKTWPTGYQANYTYTPNGFLKKVTGGGTGAFPQTTSFEILSVDARGNILKYKHGNDVTTLLDYDGAPSRLTVQRVTKLGQALGNVLSRNYTYDSLSNLLARSDGAAGTGVSESFSYDALNRLTMYTVLGGAVSPPKSTEVKYDALGNIIYKSDVGRYWYDAQRPNRLTNVTTETASGALVSLSGTRQLSYTFDDYRSSAQSINGITVGNGNLEYTVSYDSANARNVYRGETYTSFNMPNEISYGNLTNNAANTADRKLSFVYGPEHQRVRQQVQLTSAAPTSYTAGTTWYLNGEDSQGLSYEKEIKSNGTIEHKHYLNAGGIVFALFTSRTGSLNGLAAQSIRYFHQDHLASVSTVTDENGTVVEHMAFDPWGKRRRTDGLVDSVDALVGQSTDRGYTMHEHLDEVGVIHMNGRIYDPLIGRFMSADPFIQNPSNLQNFNRYSYVLNNPLALTDPSGFHCTDGPEDGHDPNEGCGDSAPSTPAPSAPADSPGGGELPTITVYAHPEYGGNNGIAPYYIWNIPMAPGGSNGWTTTAPTLTPMPILMPMPGGPLVPLTVLVPSRLNLPAFPAGPVGSLFRSSNEALLQFEIISLDLVSWLGRTFSAAMQRSPLPLVRALSVVANNESEKPTGIPENWEEKPSRDGSGREWVNPENSGDRIRVMPGNPNSPNPSQREPYVRDVRNGNQWLDASGNRIEGRNGRNSPSAHIPLRDYVFRP